MYRIQRFIRSLFVLASLSLLASCAAQPTPDANLLSTEIAATVYAGITETAMAQPTATPTLGVTATPIQLLPTNTPAMMPTMPLIPTPTTGYVPPNPPGSSGDDSKWLADVNFPDGSVLNKGESFTKIWRFQNTGTTTWTKEFQIIYMEGDLLAKNGETMFNLASDVAPGKIVEISVPFVAPTEKGTYTSIWKLFNAAGQQFGEYASVNIVVK